MPTRLLPLLLWTALLTLVIPAGAQDAPTPTPAGPTLHAIQSRGQLICGIDQEVFGFGFLDPNTGAISGLQVDLCQALAVAILGETAAVDFRLHPLDTDGLSVDSAGLDVLFDHAFVPSPAQALQPDVRMGQAVFFYDGPSIMAEAGGDIASWGDLENASVCVVADSLSAQAFAAEMDRHGVNFVEAPYPTIADMKAAFLGSSCTAQVLDRSLLEIIRASTDTPANYTVWPRPFGLRAITPLVHSGDAQWADIVDWTIWGLIEAEKLGITSANIGQFARLTAETDDAYLRRVGEPIAHLLDATLGLGSDLGLPNDYMAAVIQKIGNYGEIYDRNLGPASTLPIERGLNALWMNDGLLDAPAWR